MNNFKKVLGLVFSLVIYSSSSYAVSLNKMLVISDENGNGAYSITNDSEQIYFIETGVNEISTDEFGEVVRTPYTSDNVEDWEIAVSQPKFIVEPGRTKSLGVRAICGSRCENEIDKVFEVEMLPMPYSKNNEEKLQSVNIYVGYAPLFIIPASESKFDYKIDVDNKNLTIFNQGNSLIYVMLNHCLEDGVLSCNNHYTVIKGRKKTFTLPDSLVGQDLDITILNHDETSRENTTIRVKK